LVKTLSSAAIHALRVIKVTDIAVADLEPIIDQAIGIVNVEAERTMGYLAGTPGTVSVGDDEFAITSTLAVILAINALLSAEETTWSIERRGNLADLVGQNGALTRRYEGMLAAFKVEEEEVHDTSVGLIAWSEPLPSD